MTMKIIEDTRVDAIGEEPLKETRLSLGTWVWDEDLEKHLEKQFPKYEELLDTMREARSVDELDEREHSAQWENRVSLTRELLKAHDIGSTDLYLHQLSDPVYVIVPIRQFLYGGVSQMVTIVIKGAKYTLLIHDANHLATCHLILNNSVEYYFTR